jgi:hypothetical protein
MQEMHSTARAILTTLLLFLATVACAQQTRPASAPAADLSNPRASLRALNLAMTDGDVDTIMRLFIASNDAERKMVRADADMAAALAALRRAALTAYGVEGAKTVTGDMAGGAADSSVRIDSAEITIKGDTATVVYHDEKEAPFILKKVADGWKVPVSQLGTPIDSPALSQRLADLEMQRKVVLDITRQIHEGGLTTPDQAREAWQSRILQAATSQPASRPAGTK